MEEDNKQHIVWHDDVIVKQFISYAVGCMMGRYSIDKPGLILANQGDGVKEYEALVPNSRFPDFVTQKYQFYNWLINNILYLCIP